MYHMVLKRSIVVASYHRVLTGKSSNTNWAMFRGHSMKLLLTKSSIRQKICVVTITASLHSVHNHVWSVLSVLKSIAYGSLFQLLNELANQIQSWLFRVFKYANDLQDCQTAVD